MKMLRQALESINPEEHEAGEEDDGMEANVAASVAAIDNTFDTTQTDSVVLESLCVYEGMLENLIKTKRCTQATADLIGTGIDQQLNRLSMKIAPKYAMENYEGDAVRQHEIALEGVRDVINSLAAMYVLETKHIFDITTDLFKSTASHISKYRNRMAGAEEEYKGAKADWQEDRHTGSLTSLWYFFRNDKGNTTEVLRALDKDLDMSKFVLVTYPKQMTDMLKKLAGIVNANKANNMAALLKLGHAVEALGHPAEAFRKMYIGGKPFLNKTGLEMRHGTVRSIVSVNGKALERLSDMASPRGVVESGSFEHGALKAAMHLSHVGPIINVLATGDVTLSTQDIQRIIDHGNEYIKNVSDYTRSGSAIQSAISDFERGLRKLTESVDNQMSNADMRTVQQVLRQIEQVANNILHCYQQPASAEIGRSLRGAKYCAYLVRRMIFNAK